MQKIDAVTTHLLIDGTNLFWRFWHSPNVTDIQDAVPRWFRLLEEYPERLGLSRCRLVVAFDHPTRSTRTDILAEYKSQRPPPPADLVENLKLCIRLTVAAGIPVFIDDSMEADVALAGMVGYIRHHGFNAHILTSDKDMMQLVSDPHTILFRPENGGTYSRYTAERVFKKYGVRPDQFAAYLALVGDKSDNLKGVPGIGPKKAVNMLRNGRQLRDIILDPNGRDEALVLKHAEILLSTYSLVKLKLVPNIPVPEAFDYDHVMMNQYIKKYPAALSAFYKR